MVFKNLSVIVLLTKVASALEGLRGIIKIHSNISQNIALFLEHFHVSGNVYLLNANGVCGSYRKNYANFTCKSMTKT